MEDIMQPNRHPSPLPPDPAGQAGRSPLPPEPRSSANPAPGPDRKTWDPEPERLDEAECLRLISAGGVGRLAYPDPFGVAVLPVNYKLHEGSIVFRTTQDSPTCEDLRTGIQGAEYEVSFEIDDLREDAHAGWFVFIQGAAHHMDSEDERASIAALDAGPWTAASPEHFVRITPAHITGRRLHRRLAAAMWNTDEFVDEFAAG
jgi:nitroimidazol reductase NimA-like FMN-containing flavoprotein (pyridoxamine 5'-phosphate oxidase superfamily)